MSDEQNKNSEKEIRLLELNRILNKCYKMRSQKHDEIEILSKEIKRYEDKINKLLDNQGE